jgi:hypothetical protein
MPSCPHVRAIRCGRYGVLLEKDDEAGPGRDIDLVVSFDGAATSQRYFGVQYYREDLFGCPVDLVTDKVLLPESRFTSNGRPSMSERDPQLYLDDMSGFAGKALARTKGLDRPAFVASEMT